MKLCPACRKNYSDDTLNFCLDDGNSLIAVSPSSDMATAILPGRSGEPRTDVLPSLSVPEAVTGNSIAVLPFVNMSADVDNEYFCDGLAEELLNALAKIDDLKVAARTASFSFRGKNQAMAEIGRTLNVRSILEGSVRKAGNRVRITVQLINASDGYHLWSERYDRDMEDIFEVQDEITLAVVDALKVKLLAPEKQAMLKRHTNDAEAYQLYLRGRYFFYKRTPEGFLKAIECFEKAIEIDADYALAISGLADSYVFLGFYEMVSPAEASEKLRPLIERMIEIDENSSETNTSRALLTTLYDWKHREALKYFEAAITADPRYAFAHHLKSALASVLGEDDVAIAAEKKAIEIDPFTPVFNASLAWWYYMAGRNEEAIAQCNRTIEIAPNHFFGHWVKGLTLAEQGAYQDAIVSLQKSVSLNQFDNQVRGELGRVLAMAGEREEAMRILDDFSLRRESEYISPVNVAKVYVGLGDNDEAFNQLEKAFEERAVKLPWLIVDPCLKSLWSDPRYSDLVTRMGLPQISRSVKV